MANVYRFLKDVFDGRDSYAVYTSSGVDQGMLMQWDTGSRKAVPMTANSGAIFLGVSEECQPLAGLGSSTRPLTGDRLRIVSQGLMRLPGTDGETYSHRDPVFMGADASRITSVAGQQRIVGRVHLPDGSQVVAASGVTVPVIVLGSMTNNSTTPSSATSAR